MLEVWTLKFGARIQRCRLECLGGLFFSDVVDAVDVVFWFDSSIDQWQFEGQVVMGTEHHKHKGPCTESEMDHRDGSQA